jgi:hypothetical protein
MDERDRSAERTCKLAPDIGRTHRNRVIIHGYENFLEAQRVLPGGSRWRVLASVALIQINLQTARIR